MSELTEFLLARIAEDEAVALRADPEAVSASDAYETHPCHPQNYAEPTGWVDIDPARVLAECEAKRRIVEMAARQAALCSPDDWPETGDMSGAAVADSGRWFLRTLAAVYADHEDYDDTWRP